MLSLAGRSVGSRPAGTAMCEVSGVRGHESMSTGNQKRRFNTCSNRRKIFYDTIDNMRGPSN